jgi:hypothetical protein
LSEDNWQQRQMMVEDAPTLASVAVVVFVVACTPKTHPRYERALSRRGEARKEPGFFPVRLRSGLRLVEAELSRSAPE